MSRIAESYVGDRPYPESPGFKEPTTSRAAAEKIAATLEPRKREVLNVLREAGANGLTADEAARRIGRTVLAVRPRFSELRKVGMIRKSGLRRLNDSGIEAHVWVLND